MITAPASQVLTLASAAIHDRLARQTPRARRVVWMHGSPFVPVFVHGDAESGVRAVDMWPVQTCLLDHHLIWQTGGSKWLLRQAGASVRVTANEPAWSDDGSHLLGVMRVDVSARGMLLERYHVRVKQIATWLLRRGISQLDAEEMAFRAFDLALDRITYVPGPKLDSVLNTVMRQRCANLIRDWTRQGRLAPKDGQPLSLMEADHLAASPESLGLRGVADKLAALVLDGWSVEEAAGILQLTEAELLAAKDDIARAVGLDLPCQS